MPTAPRKPAATDVDPAVESRIRDAGANLLRHPSGRRYAQFSIPRSTAGYTALARVLHEHPDLWLRVYGYGTQPGLSDLAYLRHLPTARRIAIDHAPITDWSALASLPDDLTALEIRTASGPVPLAPIAARTQLTELALDARAAAREYPQLAALTRLERLTLSSATLRSAPAQTLFAALTRLERLTLRKCRVDDWRFVRPLSRLSELHVASTREPPDFSELAALPALTTLALHSLPLTTLDGIDALTRLTELHLTLLPRLTSLAPLAGLTALRALRLSTLKGVTALPSCARLAALETVTLNQVPALASLAPLRDARRLASLGVLGVKHLGVQDFEPLVGLPSLAHLRLGLGSIRKHEGVRARLGL